MATDRVLYANSTKFSVSYQQDAINWSIPSIRIWKPTSISKFVDPDQRRGEFPETRTSVDVLENDDELKKRGYWIGAHVTGDAAFPNKRFVVTFEGKKLFLLPQDGENLPAVFVKGLRQEAVEFRGVISRFLSAWSWSERRGLRVMQWTAGNLPFRYSDRNFKVTTLHFDFEQLPTNLPRAAAIALAHYREGLSLKHVAYSFLSFYKVINAAFKGKEEQKRWMRENLDLIEGERAQKRLQELRQDPEIKSVQDYIYTACRNAVAHSHPDYDPINPDDPTDELRLSQDLPIVQALARRLINKELGLETNDEVWDSKTRRIVGARWMIGESISAQIDSGIHVPRRSVQLPKRVRLQTRQKTQYQHLMNLNLRVTDAMDGAVGIEIWSNDRSFTMLAEINIRIGEIDADLIQGIALKDRGTVSSLQTIIAAKEFSFELFCNGRMQLIEMDTDYLIAESKPIIPVNLIVNPDGHKAELEYLTKVLRSREAQV